jgi:hypothetical protein
MRVHDVLHGKTAGFHYGLEVVQSLTHLRIKPWSNLAIASHWPLTGYIKEVVHH